MSVVQQIAESRKAPNRAKNIRALLPRYPYPFEEPLPTVSRWVMEEVMPNVFEMVMVSQAKQASGKRGRPRKMLTHQEAQTITYKQAVKRGVISRVFERVRKFIYG